MGALDRYSSIGDMRRWITIEQQAPTQNARGEEVPTWTTFATAWAAIIPLSGRELLAAQQIQASVTHRIVLRYLSGLDPSMRIVYNGRYFDIQQVININEQSRQMELQCIERVGEQ